MKCVKYSITFFSDWHCGSGLTSGSDLDSLVVKDNKGLPFIPGKTLKGLLKEAAEEMTSLEGKNPEETKFITEMFGYFDGKAKEDSKIHSKGQAFFTNAVLPEELYHAASSGLQPFFYRSKPSTAIEDTGIARKHSLRRMETTIPCRLEATILNVEETYLPELHRCMMWVKRLGQNRHRGLGRCIIQPIGKEEKQ